MSFARTLFLAAAALDIQVDSLNDEPVSLDAEKSVIIADGLCEVLQKAFTDKQIYTIKPDTPYSLYAPQSYEVCVLNGDNYPLAELFKVDEMRNYPEDYKGDKVPSVFHQADFINKQIKQAKDILMVAADGTVSKMFKQYPDTFSIFTPKFMTLFESLSEKGLWTPEKVGSLCDVLLFVPPTPNVGEQPGEEQALDLYIPEEFGAKHSIKLVNEVCGVVPDFFAGDEVRIIGKNQPYGLYAPQEHQCTVLNGHAYPLEKLFNTNLMDDFDAKYKGDKMAPLYHRATFINKLIIQARDVVIAAGDYDSVMKVYEAKENTEIFRYFKPLCLDMLKKLHDEKLYTPERAGQVFDSIMYLPPQQSKQRPVRSNLYIPEEFGAKQSIKLENEVCGVFPGFFTGDEVRIIGENQPYGLYAPQEHQCTVLNGHAYPLEKLFNTNLMPNFDEQYKGDKLKPIYHRATFINKLIREARDAVMVAGDYDSAKEVYQKNTEVFRYFKPLSLNMLTKLRDENHYTPARAGQVFNAMMYLPEATAEIPGSVPIGDDYEVSDAANADVKVISYQKTYLEQSRITKWWETSSICAIVYSGHGYKGIRHDLPNSQEAHKLSDLTAHVKNPQSIHTEPGCALAVYDRYRVKKVFKVIPYSQKRIDWVGAECSAEVSYFDVSMKCNDVYRETEVQKTKVSVEEQIEPVKYFECKCYPTLHQKKEKFLKPVYKQQIAYYKKKPEEFMLVNLYGFQGGEQVNVLGQTHTLTAGEWYPVKVPISPEVEIQALNLEDPNKQILVSSLALHKLRFHNMNKVCKTNGGCRSLSSGLLKFNANFTFSTKVKQILPNNVIATRMGQLEYLDSDSNDMGEDIADFDDDDDITDNGDNTSNSSLFSLLAVFLL